MTSGDSIQLQFWIVFDMRSSSSSGEIVKPLTVTLPLTDFGKASITRLRAPAFL